jgi:hypothetical protein
MRRRQEQRNCQIRMSASLWSQVGEMAQVLGHRDARGGHSTVIREMIALSAAMWRHSPYVCRSAHHTFYVTKDGNVFARQIQILQLQAFRTTLPCMIELRAEKQEYYQRQYYEVKQQRGRGARASDFSVWLQNRWMLNHFAVWNGRKEVEDLESFRQTPLNAQVDAVGGINKYADLAAHTAGGRFLTREILFGLRDYAEWKEPGTPIFDYISVPIDIPTSNFQISFAIDRELFSSTDIEVDEIPNIALEFRNRESARFEGKEVALMPETGIEELSGRSADDEGVNDLFREVRRLRQRVLDIVGSADQSTRAAVSESLRLPQHFLFYRLRWPTPNLGIEACVRWEKPVRRSD